MNGTNPPDRIRQQQDICSYFDLQAIGDFAGNDKMELFWRNYGMFSTETRVWLMDMDNDSYSV
ncbi:hypothetical protein [Leptodesmis sp.]|uniref:hypothetical protein n=1 Tax=Leptodesmis sp. TaxID=3100501 RepID=UPI00405355AA